MTGEVAEETDTTVDSVLRGIVAQVALVFDESSIDIKRAADTPSAGEAAYL